MKGTGLERVMSADEDTAPRAPHAARLRSVVFATDFSKGAAAAEQRVARLPLAPSATIMLLHVLPTSTRGTPASTDAEERLMREADHLRAALAKAGGRVRVRTKLAFGRPFEKIARAGMEAELVVLGRHGAGTFMELLLGSTAERVVRSAAAPVLIVGQKAAHAYRHPIAGVDMSPTSRRALELCLRVLPDPSVLEIVHAYDLLVEHALRRGGASERDLTKRRRQERAEAARILRSFLDGVGVGRCCRQHVRPGDPRSVLLGRAKRSRADLIVVGAQGHSALARMLLGSVAVATLRNAECDVLVVPSARPPAD